MKLEIVILFVLVVSGVALTILWSEAKRRDVRWQLAKQNPQWEVREFVYDDGDTQVQLALVARDGRRRHTYKSISEGTVRIERADWQLELEILRNKAHYRAKVLNEARNKAVE